MFINFEIVLEGIDFYYNIQDILSFKLIKIKNIKYL